MSFSVSLNMNVLAASVRSKPDVDGSLVLPDGEIAPAIATEATTAAPNAGGVEEVVVSSLVSSTCSVDIIESSCSGDKESSTGQSSSAGSVEGANQAVYFSTSLIFANSSGVFSSAILTGTFSSAFSS